MKPNCVVAMVMMIVLALPGSLYAHGGHVHKALGTIASIQGEQVTITTNDGKTLKVVLDKKTTITRGKDKLGATALKVGERISVDYTEQTKTMVAQAIKLATPATAGKVK
jgi:hypothetical protein